jgi:hypothetical protein
MEAGWYPPNWRSKQEAEEIAWHESGKCPSTSSNPTPAVPTDSTRPPSFGHSTLPQKRSQSLTLEELQRVGSASPALYREIKTNVLLVRTLNLERAVC